MNKKLRKLIFLCVIMLAFVFGSNLSQYSGVYAAGASLNPVLDTFIDSLYYADGSPGDSVTYPGQSVAWVGSAYGQIDDKAAMRFDLSSISGAVTAATLYIHIVNDATAIAGTPYVNLYGSNNDVWTISTIPSTDVSIVTNDTTGITIGNWKSFNVTTFINNQVAGDKKASFVLTGNPTPDNQFGFNTVADTNFKPHLDITYTNTAPTNITLSANSVAENTASGNTIGTFTATDPDSGDTVTYSFYNNGSYPDNTSFTITGNTLQTNASLNYEAKTSYSIMVRATDSVGNTYDKAFTINITNVNEVPTNISLSNSSVAENSVVATTVGNLTTTDPDTSGTYTYSLFDNAGYPDNTSFSISGSTLKTTAVFNYEAKNSYSIKIQVNDGVNTFDKVFTISVTNVNETPTDISLSASSVAENSALTTTVGSLTTTDPDTGETYTYSLYDNAGHPDNTSFLITGDVLKTNAALNYEVKNSYSIMVRVTDGGNTFDKVFTVNVTNVDEAPTNISLSNSSVAENSALTTTVGTLTTTDQDTGESYTYSLYDDAGHPDNTSFSIVGDVLKTNASLDFEQKNSYSIMVRVTDGGNTFDKAFTITITNVNEAPTDITLSNSSVAENSALATTIGTLTTTDPDASETYTYSLYDTAGHPDNTSFSIAGDVLKTSAALNYEIKNSYSIMIRVTDGGNTFDKAFTITITDANDAPTDISLTNSSIAENSALATTIGTLSTTDPDTGETYTYSLVAAYGDNDSFSISGDLLKTNTALDYETKNSYSVKVRVTDGGNTFDKIFTISITNVNETPTDISLTSNYVTEDSVVGTTIGTLSTTDPDAGETYTYSLVAAYGDNGSFSISGDLLKTNILLDYETKNSYSIKVRVTDGGNTFDKIFTINVTLFNLAPTDISLTNNSIAENSSLATTVGTLSTTDPDIGETYTYALVAAYGDNGSFSISGDLLKTNSALDYETKNSYSIKVRVTDGGNTLDKVFTINITNVDEAPTDISLTNNTVAENVISGSTVGTLSTIDQDTGETYTYSLYDNAGHPDNTNFSVAGNTLKTNTSLDYETKNSYSIMIRVTDGGNTFDKAFTVNITNVNEAPTDISLTNNAVAENSALSTTVGTLSTTDPDASETYTYSLVAGYGDNASFSISSDLLKTNTALDYETKNSYSIKVRVSDGGNTFDKTFSISVTNVNEAPTELSLTNNTIAEDSSTGATVGTLSTKDPDASETYTYSLYDNAGHPDNTCFSIDGNALKTNASFDYETNNSYSVMIRVTDGGNTFDKTFTISVTNVNEAPTDLSLSKSSIAENSALGADVGTISTTDPDISETYTYSLVDNAGYPDNSSFTITGNLLKTNAALDYETKNSYSIMIRVTDGANTFDKQFTINIDDLIEVTTVTVPGDGVYKIGNNLDFTVKFEDTVIINLSGGIPYLLLTLDTGAVNAYYLSGSGTDSLVFHYAVQSGDLDIDGITVGAAIYLNNDATLTLNGVGSTTSIQVDGVVPAVSAVNTPANGTYAMGQNLDFTVVFSEDVTITGTDSSLTIAIGGVAKNAAYQSKTANSVTYRYTVAAADQDIDGIGVTGITLNTSTINDAAGNNASLTLNGVGDTTGVLIDGIAPTVSSVSLPANGTYITTQNLDFTVNFNEAVTVNIIDGTPNIPVTLNTGGTVYASYHSGSGTNALIFRYTVKVGDQDLDGITVGGVIENNGASLKDSAGNDAALTLNSIGATTGINVNGIAVPTITFLKPVDGSTVNISTGSTIIVNLADNGAGIDKDSIQLQIDGGAWVKPTALIANAGGYTLYYIITSIVYNNDPHTVTVEVKDAAEITTSETVYFHMEVRRNGFGFGKLRFN